MYFEKFLYNSTKLLRSPIMLQTFSTRRALKGHLRTQRALEHSKDTTRELVHS